MNGEEEHDLDPSGVALPEFENVDAVQRMIRKLEKVKADMLTSVAQPTVTSEILPEGLPNHTRTFDDLSLIDVSALHFDDMDDEWLLKPVESGCTFPVDSKNDAVNLDPLLQNVRFNLVNHVKDVIKEDKEVTYKVQRDDALARLNAIRSSNSKPSSPVIKLGSHSQPSLSRGLEKVNYVYPTISRGSKNVYPTSAYGSVWSGHFDFPSPLARDNNGTFNQTSSDDDQLTTRPHHYTTPSGKQIDTRTYTRPKKNRKSLSVCEDFDRRTNAVIEDTPARSLENTTQPEMGFNDTFNVNEESNGTSTPLNVTVNMSPDLSPPRKVTRNLSYIIRRESEGQVNNNVQSPSVGGQNDHLNSTYTCSKDADFLSSPSDSNNSLHNISMEELHNMARLQEQSLRVTSTPKTLTRKDTQTLLELPNIDERPRPPGRTSSTDTYCVVQSNPDSAESSGLSSPMDAQSYEDIQTADAVRRSMPNLALIKGVNGLRGPMLQLAPPMNSLKQRTHHISDSKLSQFVPRSSMEPRTSSSSIPSSSSMLYQHRRPGMGYQRPPLSYASSGPSVNNGSRLPNNNVRSSGLPTPRYSSAIPRGDANSRMLNPTSSRSMLPAMASNSATTCQQTFVKPQSARVQSRIPAPGAMRSRTRTVVSARDGSSPNDHGDWRDGCY